MFMNVEYQRFMNDPGGSAVVILQKALAEVIRKSNVDNNQFMDALKKEIQDVLQELSAVPPGANIALEHLLQHLSEISLGEWCLVRIIINCNGFIVHLFSPFFENSALSCGCCGDVDGRDRRRSARLGRRRAVVSEAAGIQRVLRVRMESLRADSVFSRGGIQRPPVRVAGPCRVAVSACSAPDRQDAGLRWRCRCRVGATEPIQEPVSVRDRRQCAAWKLTHPGGVWSRRRAVVSDARHCSACGGRDGGKESLRGTSWR